jgi:mono/diheme cytochrome c family protein
MSFSICKPTVGILAAGGVFIVLAGSYAGILSASQSGAAASAAGSLAEGRELFTKYCASCHGTGATGNGPAAPAMRRSPPDLTGLALANGGLFPAERVGRIVDGRDVESHGDRDMPVWGDAFKAMSGGHSEQAVRGRIKAIVDYLVSIQRRQA